MLTLDNFYGFSSGWVRYMLAELDAQEALDDFRMDWAIASNATTDPGGNPAGSDKLLPLLKAFLNRLNALIQGETKQWAAEFQQSVAIIQNWTKNPQTLNQLGTITLTVTRGMNVDPKVDVWLDGQPWASGTGPTIVLSSVTPGQHQITCKGTKVGAPIENSVAATASANTITPASASLT
jgi:hypothetical protein